MNLAALFPHLARLTLPVRRLHALRSPVKALWPPAPPHRLQRHATWRLPDRCATLQVLKGCVWVTRDGCPADWVLDAGQCFQQQPGAPVLVHALEDAELALATGVGGAQNDS